MSVTFKPLPPPVGEGPPGYVWDYLKRLYDAFRGIQAGKLNCMTTVTLTENVTTTTLTDARIGAASVILFMPTTSNAAGAMTNLYVSARAQGSATLTHSNTATTDRTFDVAILG